jgi:cytoskeletal protein RodZ
MAARTRIPLKTLRAIEENNFSAVPSGIFVRSFIRTYAREVGVDPGEAIAEYQAMTEPIHELAPQISEAPPIEDDLRSSSYDPELLTSRPGWGYALIAAAVLIGVISMNRNDAAERVDAPAPAAVPPATVPAPAPRPVATGGAAVRIEMRADGLCWVRAVADGQTVVARLLQPGEAQTVSAERDVVLRIGDPSALSYSINGRPGQPLGAARIPVTVRIGADGQLSPVP